MSSKLTGMVAVANNLLCLLATELNVTKLSLGTDGPCQNKPTKSVIKLTHRVSTQQAGRLDVSQLLTVYQCGHPTVIASHLINCFPCGIKKS